MNSFIRMTLVTVIAVFSWGAAYAAPMDCEDLAIRVGLIASLAQTEGGTDSVLAAVVNLVWLDANAGEVFDITTHFMAIGDIGWDSADVTQYSGEVYTQCVLGNNDFWK